MHRMQDMDDATLVRAAREGDREAFASIYDRYADRIHAFCLTIVRDHHEAADVAQDTFLDAGARLGQLRDPTKLRPWLFSIARHNAFRFLRARKRTEPVADLETTTPVAAFSADPSEAASRSELAELFDAASEGLSERDRALLDLNMRHGLEGQELGEAMGVSAGHAYVLLNRLRGQLERTLGALLVARKGSDDCTELAAVLEGWDGRWSPLMRKRVARHIEHCEICAETKKRTFSPAQLLSAMPLVPAPAAMRERVLRDVKLVSHRGRPWSRDGFPPREMEPARLIRRTTVVAAVLLLLLGGGASVLGVGPLGTPEQAPVQLSTGTGPEGLAPDGGVPQAPVVLDVTPSPTPVPGPAGGPGPALAPPAPATPAPATPAPATPTPVPPVITGLSARPTSIWETGCQPTVSTVSAQVNDPSIASAVMRWSVAGNTGSTTMQDAGGGRWTAPLGGFGRGTVPEQNDSVPIAVTVQVTGAGGQSSSSTTVQLHRCPTPG